MKAAERIFKGRSLRYLFLIAVTAFIPCSCELWGKYENPTDPKSDTYAGYDTVANASELTAVSPSDGADITAWDFVVSKLAGADTYQLDIGTDTAFSNPVFSQTYTTNEITVTGLSSYGKWYWRARAKKAGETWGTVWTTTRMFTRTASSVSGTVTTRAGIAGTYGSADSTNTNATFYNPAGICSDGTYYYVADSSNHLIRRILITTNAVSTFAGSGTSGATNGTGTAAQFNTPTGVCTDGTYIYVADSNNNMIRRIVISSGVVTTFAGSTTSGTTNGTGTAARFSYPHGLCVSGSALYVADAYNSKIRKIDITNASVTDFAGSGAYGTTNGTGTSASFRYPFGICSDGTNLYVADAYAHMIRKIVISSTVVTTLAGSTTSGSTDASGTSARFNYPYDVSTDGTNVFVADNTNNRVRKIVLSTATVTTLAGSSTSGSTDGTGTSALFNGPAGVYADGTLVIVGDSNNHKIRKIVVSSTVVTTLSGTGSAGSLNTYGTATFNSPKGICTDGTYYYLTDADNHMIRKITIANGSTSTLAGSGSPGFVNGTGTAAVFNNPRGICTDGTNLYIADTGNNRIRKIVISSGVVTTLAGSGSAGSTNATGTAASFNGSAGICTDGTNLFVADTQNNLIRKIVISSAVVTTLAGSTTSGTTDATGTSARFYTPNGICTDGSVLYVADTANHLIRAITISGGVVTTLAGSSSGFVNATGTSARFSYPHDVAYGTGCLYVADSSNNAIRKIVVASAAVTTLAGSSSGTSGTSDGSGTAARFNDPWNLVFDYAGLAVSDTSNHTIRVIR